MALVVPFDGSELSKSALIRAAQFDSMFDQGIVTLSVIPQSPAYARERGWIDPGESFDEEVIITKLQSTVEAIAPDAEFHSLTVDGAVSSNAIANMICKFARDCDASIVFIGSENAGRVASSLTVGSSVTADGSYDTMIISHREPSQIEELEAAASTEAQTEQLEAAASAEAEPEKHEASASTGSKIT